jgi:histidinol-phosphate phosphatase family protein
VVFLDRDGVINEYPGDFNYVARLEEFKLLPHVRTPLEKLCAAGYHLFVVSTQAGVSKGLYTRKDLDAMDAAMKKELGGKVNFDGIFYCTHRSEENCSCRKPKTGLLERGLAHLTQQGLSVDKGRSFFIGDSIVDVQTGKNAGVRTILVFSGREKKENRTAWQAVPDHTADALAQAADIILNNP